MRTAWLVCAVLCASAIAQTVPIPKFADPVRLKAGDKFMGQGRLYPSPVLHDISGDGMADVVVGDLVGALTVAQRLAKDSTSYGEDTKLVGADGKPIRFHNW